ncbi:MAG: acetate--CoA ligase [bacterium]|nr:acetate--CoA ligase [bacterium]
MSETQNLYYPSNEFREKSRLGSMEAYEALYQESVLSPEAFWLRQAEENLSWFKRPSVALAGGFPANDGADGPYLSFFKDGTLNLSANCLDRHIGSWRRNKAAIIWQGEKEEDRRTLTYQQLHTDVCRFANVLKKRGVVKGTRVTIFLPMVPELVIAMLACARLGAIHSIVFSAFSGEALKSRIIDAESEVVITSDVSFHGGRTAQLKARVNEAIEEVPAVHTVIVLNRGHSMVEMQYGRDFWWQNEVFASDIFSTCEPEIMNSEDPLFLLYTSGSTGKPKGVMHTTAGYLLYTHLTFKYIFDIREEDIFFCTADIGWITGHSYVTYGPLSNGATIVMFEGTPTYPTPDRFWKIIDDYQVNIFYTAPTAIRGLMRLDEKWINRHQLSSLRLLGSVGEPINPEAWRWYHRVIGKGRCPIVDTWWQTETGGIMISTLPGAHAAKPGSAGKPFFGIVPEVEVSTAGEGQGGALYITSPWPGMIRGVYGDSSNQLVKQTYFSRQEGKYFTGDGCLIDEDGYYWLQGRIDDVINVSAHRFSTAEIESSLVGHNSVAEAAVVGVPHETKGQGIYCFVTLKEGVDATHELRDALRQHVRDDISPIATPEHIQFAPQLPKTRSGKIMRRILRKVAAGETDNFGDISTLAEPAVVEQLVSGRTGY